MSRRFIELVVRARRLVTRASQPATPGRERARLTARRQVGGALTQFSFRLALMVDLAYVGIGALGGVAIGHASAPVVEDSVATQTCRANSMSAPSSVVLR